MKILLIVLVVLAAALVAAAYALYRLVFMVCRGKTLNARRVPKGEQYAAVRTRMLQLIDSAAAIPCEPVETKSFDGLTLRAKYYETAPGAPIQIMFHGYRSAGVRDFCGGLPQAIRDGYNILLVDQRAHGKSDGKCLTFGVLERRDCLSWIEYANARFGTKTSITLVGVSMGAATVLMASALELPANVTGIIADCGYSSPEAIIRKVSRDRKCPDRLLFPLVSLGAKLFGHFDPRSASAEEALRHCKIPVLFLHGEDDRFVPCEMSRINCAACASEKTLVTFPGAGHALSFLINEAKYTSATHDFLEKTNPIS